MSNERRTVLQVKGVSKDFGGLRALDDVDLDVKEGKLSRSSTNGAGKTTFLTASPEFYNPTEGDVNIDPKGEGLNASMV